MSFVEPSFEIDHKGRVLCQYHSQYAFFIKPGKTSSEEEYLEKILTCKTCQHYRENDCYFPTLEINKIESDRIKAQFRCKLCGNLIHRIFTVIHKLYVKERYNIDMPLICCNCYENIKENSLIENFRKITSEKKYSFLLSFECLIILIMISLVLLVFLPVMFQFFIIFIGYWVFILTYFIFYYVRKLYYIHRGQKYFHQFSSK